MSASPSPLGAAPHRSPVPMFLHRHALTLVLLGGVAALLAHASLMLNFWSDDAFISYRYARNIATGLGAVYNPGERVEGYSNPLFTLVLAAFYRVLPGPDMVPWIARGLCVLSGVATLVVLTRLEREISAWIVGVAILLCAMNTSFALWTVGGLETTTYGFFITAAFVLSARVPATTPARVGLGLLLAAIVLSRPDGVLPAGALFLWRLLDSRTRGDVRGHVVIAACAAVPVLAYLAFRLLYFGSWLPNTYFAKKISYADAFWRGLWYLKSFLERNGNLAVYAPALLAPFGAPGERRVARLALLVLAVYSVFLFVVGGDWMSNHRFLAPLVPLLFLVVATGWVSLLRLVESGLQVRRARRAVWAIPIGCAFLCVLFARPTMSVTRDQRQRPNMSVIPYFDVIGRVVGHAAPRDWTLATHDIGAVGWYGGTRILDMLGLVDHEIGHKRISGDSAIAARRPELVLEHYDNRYPPKERWLPVNISGFDSLYTRPTTIEGLPRSLRVRRDVAAEFDRRLATVPEKLRQEVRDLRDHLVHHQPDMYPVLVSDPP